jgi:ubiquinone/menaquinone biosynthesis C-methylase UbiE
MTGEAFTDQTRSRCHNPVEHYERDAEIYDYFSPPHPVQADFWQRLRIAAVRYLSIKKGMHVVDVGSGGGWFSQMMRLTDVKITSVDLSLKNLQRITGEYESNGVMASASHLPIADESVDAVIASEVIEHLNDPGEAIAEFIRIVKQGGRVVITTPYSEVIKQHVCIHCNRSTPANAHLHSFDESKLTMFFSHGGAHEIYYRRIGNKAFIISRLSFLLRWLPFPIWSCIDRCANIIIRKPAHIIVCGIKQGK